MQIKDITALGGEETTPGNPAGSRMTEEYVEWMKAQRPAEGGPSLMDAVRARHSVREFTDRPVDAVAAQVLQKKIDAINEGVGVHFQLLLNEPKAFGGKPAHYGKFVNCRNYIALVAPKGADNAVGYYGEQLVLMAQLLGLNTCWVALTYSKRNIPVAVKKGDKLFIVIALGYGKTQGVPHNSKNIYELCECEGAMPAWFRKGVECAALAPTAVNQQQFRFKYVSESEVEATTKFGPCSKIDLGIAEYHFEIGAEGHPFEFV